MQYFPPHFELASYQEAQVRRYKGNPFIEALPPKLSTEDVFQYLSNPIDFYPEDRYKPTHIRKSEILVVRDWYTPQDTTLRFYEIFSSAICDGLVSRNPTDKNYWKNMNAMREEARSNDVRKRVQKPQLAVGSLVYGDSGVGKSSGLRTVQSLYPQVVVHGDHERYPGLHDSINQLPYLVVECAHDGSVRGTMLNLIEQVDQLLCIRGYTDRVSDRTTTNTLIGIVAEIVANHGVGVLVIDEVQNLREAKSGEAEKMFNWFVNMYDLYKIPIITLSTPRILPLLRSAFRNARRNTGLGDLVFRRMQFDDEWDDFVEELWQYQYVRNPVPLNTELSQALYYESQGIHDLATKMFIIAQMRAMDIDPSDERYRPHHERITKENIHSVREDFHFLQVFLTDIREGRIPKIPYEDMLEMTEFDQIIRVHVEGIPQNTITVQTQDDDTPPQSKPQSVSEVEKPELQPQTKPIPKSKKTKKLQKKQTKQVKAKGLMEAFIKGQKQEKTAYTSLKEAGFIRPITDIL